LRVRAQGKESVEGVSKENCDTGPIKVISSQGENYFLNKSSNKGTYVLWY